ncbi:hypothetical protein D4764_05G0012430 [Takifugu flavidus]|uniref:Uncharacterized protein n=1 Tax=Takifugu flavidus TaxID=433684 RepID=A0A5C6N1P0_9TELE|nr:hypothetical protein D4764_05G0012430 [Takifugu flavidus]
MGIQRAGYQTVQSAGKIQNVPLAHLELAVAAEAPPPTPVFLYISVLSHYARPPICFPPDVLIST